MTGGAVREAELGIEGRDAFYPLIGAVAAALAVLRSDRAMLLESSALPAEDGRPDPATVDPETAPYLAEYDRVIAMCEDALRKAGLQ